MGLCLVWVGSGNVIEVIITGEVSRNDGSILERLAEPDRTRFLFRMADPEGWRGAAVWDDPEERSRCFRNVERVALLGAKNFREQMSQFGKPFRAAQLRHFPPTGLAAARTWLETP